MCTIHFFFIVASVSIFSCSTKIIKPLDKEWTLNEAPNALDVVGVIFAIDSDGKYKSIPGGILDLKTLTSPVAIPERTKTKNVSLNVLANFLAIKNIDSTASVSFYDSNRVNASFEVNNGQLTRINDDILGAFNKKKGLIESNIAVLGLEQSRLYIILETVQSSNVNIILNKSNKWGAEMNAKVKEMIKANTRGKGSTTNNVSLVYNSGAPVTVFYKLNAINVFKIKDKSDGKDKYEIELGQPVHADVVTKRR
ncbi:hypothetical protein FAM09_23295 [Niastella caeni]|uniref:Gasdermin bGSDM n=1 Tax=Niastella caeni TaxID=2569763 RepID=A0A4S8HI85_9BACT|nr:hypothetical protein [Niastella caeni]THU34920.1 hypothetical protein FAM09_23295 [Niastella caeni]